MLYMKSGKLKILFIKVMGMVAKTPLEKIGEIAKLFEQPINRVIICLK